VILVFLCVPTAVAMAIVPLPNTPSANDPNHSFNIILLVRVGGTLLYAMFAALGGYATKSSAAGPASCYSECVVYYLIIYIFGTFRWLACL
jgi:hypothetical protein